VCARLWRGQQQLCRFLPDPPPAWSVANHAPPSTPPECPTRGIPDAPGVCLARCASSPSEFPSSFLRLAMELFIYFEKYNIFLITKQMLTKCTYSPLLTRVHKLYPYEYIRRTKCPTDREISGFTIDISLSTGTSLNYHLTHNIGKPLENHMKM
jgi:hypothetical protein